MTSFIDESYILHLQPYLRNFKKKSNIIYNASCPICKDSRKNSIKARLYIIKRPGIYTVYCHNCHYSSTLPGFIKLMNEDLYKKYSFEKYKAGANRKNNHIKIEDANKINVETNDLTMTFKFSSLTELPSDNKAVKYAESRKIPKDKWDRLFYASNIEQICEVFPKYEETLTYSDARLLIPYYNTNGLLVACQARSLDPTVSDLGRYLSFKLHDDIELIYGLNWLDTSKNSYVVEGPIDSLFLPNCVAASNADLTRVAKYMTKDTVYIFDNQPRNKEVVKMVEKAISKGFNVFIWPRYYPQKDINDLMKDQESFDLLQFVKDNTWKDVMARVKFDQWKKV